MAFDGSLQEDLVAFGIASIDKLVRCEQVGRHASAGLEVSETEVWSENTHGHVVEAGLLERAVGHHQAEVALLPVCAVGHGHVETIFGAGEAGVLCAPIRHDEALR